jgi:hypothetical protein
LTHNDIAGYQVEAAKRCNHAPGVGKTSLGKSIARTTGATSCAD